MDLFESFVFFGQTGSLSIPKARCVKRWQQILHLLAKVVCKCLNIELVPQVLCKQLLCSKTHQAPNVFKCYRQHLFAQRICPRETWFIYFSRSVFQSLRSLLGEELAEFLESEERERRLDAVRSRIRLLRDLRMDTRARGMWARLLNDQPAPRKHKSGNKKGGSTTRSGCFGHKMDRIGTISGMGC